jgi:hypothetical protein
VSDTQGKQGSTPFLKKRNKKLLLLCGGTWANCLARGLQATSQSFLALFFKKELLLLRVGIGPLLSRVP